MQAEDATTYAIVVRSSDPTNFWINYKSGYGYAGGACYYLNGVWIQSTQDHNFMIYGVVDDVGTLFESWTIGTGQKAYSYESAQTFLTTSTHPIDSIALRCARFSKDSPETTLTIEIQATTDGKPNGTVLATATIAYNDLPVSFAWLTITFDVAEVTTQAASDIGVDNAVGNGTTIGGDATERGFEIKLAFSGTLYEYIQRHMAGFSTGTVTFSGGVWTGTITKTVTETGTFVAESFTGDLGRRPIAVFSDRLFAGETYDYRARATIDETVYYGGWVEFTTATYPAGQGPDDQMPIEDIIPIEPPIIPEELPFYLEWPEYPPFELPEFEWPDFDYPEIPSYDGSWLGWFYYRKAYTKKDLDELRKKCRIFQDNSVEYALVVNHNSRVLQQFLNSMTDYMGADEHNTFRPIMPPEHLNALARSPLDVHEFKAIINNFINNSIDNSNNVNNNFRLIRDGLSDYAYTEDEGFVNISVTTRLVVDNNPDVERLKKVIDRLNKEAANNYRMINHNLHVLRSILI